MQTYFSVSIAGSCKDGAIELVQEIGKGTTVINEDTRNSFSVATPVLGFALPPHLHLTNVKPTGFALVGEKKSIYIAP